jgi:hypothetical protein
VNPRTFWAGLVVVVVLIVGVGAGIAAANGSHHRPEGAAEHWLEAVGDTTRKGVHDDAVKRAEKIGPVSIAAPLIPANTEKKVAFPDLEVGKATLSTDGIVANVPYRLHQHAVTGADPLKQGDIVLRKDGSTWHVFALADRSPGEKVPSEGGKPPSSAPASLWIAGVIVGLALTIATSALVVWAERSARAAPAAA